MKPYLLAMFGAVAVALCACGGQSNSGAQPPATSTVTVTATPSASGAAASTAVQTPSPSAAAVPAGCLGRYLNITAKPTGAAAGSSYATLVFKNLNNASCTLYGFPGVAQATGRPIHDVGQPSSEDTATKRELVTLAPEGYAYATLQIADALNFPTSVCMPVKSAWLNVIPPNQFNPLPVSYSSMACKGSAKLLTVTAVRPGTGS
ncbi:MAG TPA: DUF4232 domain-containing protein [Streptosporangiaceae bacterium]